MPRLTKSVPKYRKHSTGQAYVELAGHRHYLGPWKSKASRIEYDRLIGEWLVNNRRPFLAAKSITVLELCGRFREWAEGYYVKNGEPTCIDRIKCAIRHARQNHGRIPVAEFGPLALKSIRQRLIEDGLARSYINNLTATIVQMFKWGVGEQIVPSEVYQALATVGGLRQGKSAARETETILPVDDAIVAATLPFMPEVPADMVRLQRLTGMRPAEVCILRPCDLDRSSDVWIYTPSSHKTEHHGRQRIIFVGPQAQAILLRYLARDANDYCFSPRDSEAKRRAAMHSARVTPLSCGNRPGSNVKRKPRRSPNDRYDASSYRRAIHRACDLAFPHPGLGKAVVTHLSASDQAELRRWQSDHRWSPNRLRHAAATAVRKEFGLEAAQVVLGHSQAAVTQIYAERDSAKGIEVARRIG